jgi:hypothetical protein
MEAGQLSDARTEISQILRLGAQGPPHPGVPPCAMEPIYPARPTARVSVVDPGSSTGDR